MTMKTDTNRFGFLLNDVTRLYRQAFERAISEADLELTPGEVRALMRVSALEGARQNEIADQLGIEPMTLCRYLDRLEEAGLIVREADPADRRAKRVNTTDAAAPILRKVQRLSDRLVEHMLTGLSAQQCDALREGLKIVRRNFDRIPTQTVTPKNENFSPLDLAIAAE